MGAGLLVAPAASAFELMGKVVDSSGAPISEARVWLCQDREIRTAGTDASGAFAFDDVAVHATEIVAHKEGYAVGGANAHTVSSGAVTVTLAEPDTMRLRIKDRAYEPIPGARIRTMIVGDAFEVFIEDLGGTGFPAARSDEDGRMEIPALPKGSHVRFAVSHRRYADSLVAYLPVGGKERTILMYPGVTIRGRITDDKGKGLDRARVSLLRVGVGERRAAEVLAGPEGFYNATVPPGDYRVAARHPDFASPKPHSITLEEESDSNAVDVALLPAHVIEGSVVLPGGAPCMAVPISYVVDGAVYFNTLTQADGMFRLRTPPGEGHIRIVPPPGYMTETLEDVPVVAIPDTHVTMSPFRLKALPLITGAVLDKDGGPMPDVLIASRNLAPKVWAVTDDAGTFGIQLELMPDEPRAAFRAEHARRFLRRDFDVPLRRKDPITVHLDRFEPDLDAREVETGQNDLSLLKGEKAPDFACGEWFNTGEVTLESLRGKVAVLMFWGGFDTREESYEQIEEMRALAYLYRDADDVAVIGIHDGSKDRDDVGEYVKEYGIRFPVGRDNDAFETFERYEISYIPQTVLLDKEGVLRYFRVQGRLLELIKSLRRL